MAYTAEVSEERVPGPAFSGGAESVKIALVTNVASHYRIKVFAAFARMCRVEFYFFSDGGEWYWRKHHGMASKVGFACRYLRGFWLGRTRITPGLGLALLFNQYDVFIKCINGKFALPLTYAIARLRRKPFVLWTGIWHRLGTPFHKLAFPLTRFLYRHADAVVVYGEHVRRYLISEGVQPQRIFLACQAIDNEQYRRAIPPHEKEELRARYHLAADQKIVLYLGRLEAGKGLEYLLEAFARLRRPDAVLLLCGSGSEEARLRAIAMERGIGNQVWFAGPVPPEQTTLFYSVSWVAVLPSVTTPTLREPWGLTVNETFNQGVPVITTDAVGAAAGGLVRNGSNGFVVPERDAAALHDALDAVLGDRDLRNRLGRQAAIDIATWTQERMATGFRDAVAYVSARREREVCND